jgi:hypothetical protein
LSLLVAVGAGGAKNQDAGGGHAVCCKGFGGSVQSPNR